MTILAAIAIAIAVVAVWGLLFLLRGSLLGGAAAFLVVGCCFNEYFFRLDLGPATLTLERLVLAALLAAYAVQRFFGRTDPKKLQIADLLLAGFLGVLALSLLTGEAFRAMKGDVPPLWRLLAGYLMPAIIYWIARQSRLTERRVYGVLAALVGLGLYLSLTGLLEAAGQWSLVFPRHIADPKLGLHFGRARGPMLQSVTFGTFVCAGLFSAWICRERLGRMARRFRPSHGENEKRRCRPEWFAQTHRTDGSFTALYGWSWARIGRIGLALLLPLFAAGIYVCYTRSVWMGAGLALFLVLAFTLHRSWRPLVLGGMLAAVLLLGIFKSDSFMGFQREYSASDTRDSAGMRVSFAYVSWQMFLDRPILGCGLGRFAQSKLPYLADRSTEIPLERIRDLVHHNHYLSLLTETGFVGFSLFLALISVWAWDAWKMARRPGTPDWIRSVNVLFLAMLAVTMLQWMGHELSYSPLDHSLLFLLAGITAGLRPQLSCRLRQTTVNIERGRRDMESATEIPVSLA